MKYLDRNISFFDRIFIAKEFSLYTGSSIRNGLVKWLSNLLFENFVVTSPKEKQIEKEITRQLSLI